LLDILLPTVNEERAIADSTLVGAFLPLGVNPLTGGDIDLHVVAKSPDAVYE